MIIKCLEIPIKVIQDHKNLNFQVLLWLVTNSMNKIKSNDQLSGLSAKSSKSITNMILNGSPKNDAEKIDRNYVASKPIKSESK